MMTPHTRYQCCHCCDDFITNAMRTSRLEGKRNMVEKNETSVLLIHSDSITTNGYDTANALKGKQQESDFDIISLN